MCCPHLSLGLIGLLSPTGHLEPQHIGLVPIRTPCMLRVPLVPRPCALILLWNTICGQTIKAESETQSHMNPMPCPFKCSHHVSWLLLTVWFYRLPKRTSPDFQYLFEPPFHVPQQGFLPAMLCREVYFHQSPPDLQNPHVRDSH